MTLGALALRPGGSGVQTYIRELVRSLTDVTRADLRAVVQADAVGELPPTVSVVVRRPSDGIRRALTGLRGAGPTDLVHGLDVDLPLRPSAPTVTTVHDLSVFDVPWAGSRLRVGGERFLVRRAVRRADVVVAVSAFTAERVRAVLGRDAVVTPLAPDPAMAPPDSADVARVRAAYDLPARFVLQVGTIEPRKDVATLAAACRAVPVPLVLAGAVAPGEAVPAGATSLGYVPRGDLPALYGAATVVAYLSVYEGFGLPPVEAMACGAPVVASRVASLPDVLGDGAELVPLRDADAVAAVLRELLADDDRREALSAAGLVVARSLSWRATAEATAAAYRTLGVAV